jgi:hypothetical protein
MVLGSAEQDAIQNKNTIHVRALSAKGLWCFHSDRSLEQSLTSQEMIPAKAEEEKRSFRRYKLSLDAISRAGPTLKQNDIQSLSMSLPFCICAA